MRVLIFSTAYLPLVGGAEVAVKEITDRLPDIEFVMVTARMSRKHPVFEKIGNIAVHRIGTSVPIVNKFYLALFGYRKGMKLHKEKKFDIVWSIMASYSGFAALTFKKKAGVKFLLTLQEGDPIEYILKKVRFVRKRFDSIFSFADGLQAISEYLMQWGRDMGFGGSVAGVIPNGVDVEKFGVRSSEFRQEFANKFDISVDSKIIITISRLVKKNGVEDLIRAMKSLPSSTRLLVLGTGELEQELKQKARDLDLIDRVHFVGNVDHDKIPEYLWASDVFCRPSLSEGLGNVFLEAMAADVPIVGTPVGGIPDFLIDGETGLFCEVGNPKDIAEKIQKILDDGELADSLRENGRKLVEEKYTWDSVVQNMKTLMNEMI